MADLASLVAEFEHGAQAASDPSNQMAIQSGGEATTSLRSFWLHQRCPVCKHTFRPGDDVEIAADRTVRHRTVLLPCASKVTPPEPWAGTAEFIDGVNQVWPPPEDVEVVVLAPGHRLLAPPLEGIRRKHCVICGHTFREFDQVVICPCSPGKPICQAAVHRDTVNGLNCLDAWWTGQSEDRHCPIT
ncbi:MAG: hypothetical protein ACLQVD_17540 [Capsulimonadaceae bacterium]